MFVAVVALLVWTGPHTPCVLARPYAPDGAVSQPQPGKQKIDLLIGGGMLQAGPDRQSATVCALRRRERSL